MIFSRSIKFPGSLLHAIFVATFVDSASSILPLARAIKLAPQQGAFSNVTIWEDSLDLTSHVFLIFEDTDVNLAFLPGSPADEFAVTDEEPIEVAIGSTTIFWLLLLIVLTLVVWLQSNEFSEERVEGNIRQNRPIKRLRSEP